MLWIKNHLNLIITFGIFFSALLSVSLSSPSYAIADISTSFTTGTMVTGSSQSLFPNCTGTCLSDFHYLIVDVSSYPTLSNQFYEIDFNIRINSSGRNLYMMFPFTSYSDSRYIFPLDLGTSWQNSGITYYISQTNPSDLTFTLTESYASSPSGSLSITENGTFDVTNYASVDVDVPNIITSEGQYHDDLVNIKLAILICGGIILVIYFFYAIYKMFLGGKTL